jgi:hypothetical protein
MKSFDDYTESISASTNKVGFLITMFKELHPHAPQSDMVALSGRVAGIVKLSKGNTAAILKAIWCSSAQELKGSHLDYITKSVASQIKNTKSALEGHAGMEVE